MSFYWLYLAKFSDRGTLYRSDDRKGMNDDIQHDRSIAWYSVHVSCHNDNKNTVYATDGIIIVTKLSCAYLYPQHLALLMKLRVQLPSGVIYIGALTLAIRKKRLGHGGNLHITVY